MGIHEIEYMIMKKNQTTVTATQESEGIDHVDAAWKLQQKIKNELDPYGDKAISVLVNLNEKK